MEPPLFGPAAEGLAQPGMMDRAGAAPAGRVRSVAPPARATAAPIARVVRRFVFRATWVAMDEEASSRVCGDGGPAGRPGRRRLM